MNVDSLQLLIHQLSKTEKRYFKLFATQFGKAKNPVYLFKLMDKPKIMNELAIKRLLLKAKIKTPLPVLKNNLLNLILKALKQYNSGSKNDISYQVNELMENAAILFNKGMNREGIQTLDKAYKIAEDAEKFILIYQVCEKLRRSKRFKNITEKEKYVRTIFEKEAFAMSQQQEYTTYVRLWNELSLTQHKNFYCRTEEDFAFIEEVLSHRFLQKDYKPLSLRSLGYKLSILGDGYRYLEKNNKAVAYHEEAFITKEKEGSFVNDPKSYISSVHNILVHALLDKDFATTLKYLELIESNKFEEIELHNRAFVRHYLNSMEYYKYALNIKEGIMYGEANLPYLESNQDSFTPIHWGFCVFGLGALYFMDKQYEKAICEFDKIEHHSSIEGLSDIVTFVKILKLFSYYEMQEREYLTHYLRNTLRFLQEKKRMFEFETILLKHLKKMMKNVLAGDVRLGYKDLLKAISPLSTKLYERNAFNLFDFDIWLQSRIENRAMDTYR